MRKYNSCVFIARLQPPHAAHIRLIESALEMADKVIIILGSHRAAPDIKNPWTAEERKEMVLSCFKDSKRKKRIKEGVWGPLGYYHDRIVFCPVRDQPYHDTNWMTEVHQKVIENTNQDDKIALIGHKKDETSFYLDFFPQWDLIDPGETMDSLNATDIREQLFSDMSGGAGWKDKVSRNWRNSVHPGVASYLTNFMKTERFKNLVESQEFIKKYKKRWDAAPFPPTFVTTDTVVVKSGHVLLVQRKCNPGKDLYALPGGFLNQDEYIIDGAIRELREETRIDVKKSELKELVTDSHVFDHPRRDLRGRTITHAYLIKLPDGGQLPKVKGSDDAKGAYWVPLAELPFLEEQFFSDHMQIINYFTR
jgi:bifunctional NMN adenylyltransferase/nudix hydrolase